MSVNPQTGIPEFGFFKSIKKIFKAIAPIAAIAAPFLLPGVGAGLTGALGGFGSALGTASKVLGVVNSAKGLFGGGEQKPQQQMLAQQQIAPPVEAAQAPEFTPARPDALARPQSLNELSSFSPEQERSALATRGMNQGLGDDENKYYRNLLQRSLIGDGNQVQGSNDSFLMPIESQYFSQQGQNTSNLMEFLKGIQG